MGTRNFFKSEIILVNEPGKQELCIHSVKSDYNGLRVFAACDKVFYLLTDFKDTLGFEVSQNPDIKYTTKGGHKVIEYKEIINQLKTHAKGKGVIKLGELGLTDLQKSKLRRLIDSHDCYTKPLSKWD